VSKAKNTGQNNRILTEYFSKADIQDDSHCTNDVILRHVRATVVVM
jgi:hypothetical protein